MGKIRMRSASISENPQLNAPKFHFSQYEVGRTYNNNDEIIDFVTDGNSLYVCQVNAVTTSHENIAEQEGFLKLVSQGPQGIRGPRGEDGDSAVAPRIDVNFDDDQLRVKVNGETKALSPSLTGPTWKPVLEDNVLTWELTDDRYMPDSIDLMNLRPIQEHPILLRTNSDNTKRSDESSGPANFIQWKYEGDEYWTNLISISELMNLALAGVSIWQNSEGKWHFGHKEVVKANYISDKNGRKIISNVRLGDVLFDAGELPFAESAGGNDYGTDIDLIWQKLAELEASMVKTVNHEGPDPDGNVNVETGDGVLLFNVRFDNSTHKLQKTTDGQTWIDIVDLDDYTGGSSGDGLTEAQVKTLIGKILEGIEEFIPDEYVRGADHNYFIRRSDLSDYRTYEQIAAMIRDAMLGENNDYYRVFTLYQRTNSGSIAPSKPVKGVWIWDTVNDEMILKPNVTSNWSNHPDNASVATPYLWITTATYSFSSKAEVGEWETPICLTGEAGQNGQVGRDGVDGDSVEFAYLLCTEEEWNIVKSATLQPIRGDNTKDDLPRDINGVSHSWTDHPSGISPEYKIEAVTIRTKDGGTWSNYSNATIWAKWGEDGIDGDGVEYIFFVASNDDVNTDSNGKITLKLSVYSKGTSGFIPTNSTEVEELGDAYQVPDWISVADNNWTDDPSDVDSGQPFEFVAIRKYRYSANEKSGSWGPFSTPTLWAHYGGVNIYPKETVYGQSNYRPYRCFSFYRAAENDYTDYSNYTVEYDFSDFATQQHPNPTYSDLTDNQKQLFYDNPQNYTKTLNASSVEVPIVWEDTVPSGNGVLWMITAHIGDESQASDTGWTSPVMFGDSPGIEVEYAEESELTTKVYNDPSKWNSHNLTLNDFTGDRATRVTNWETAVYNAGYGVWGESISSPTYMAISVKLENGSWSDWEISKIKGEKGDKGDAGEHGNDGNGVEFVFFALTPEQYNDRTNFIGTSNKFYVYDDVEHLTKSYTDSNYLPYAKIVDGVNDKLWAVDDNPGITPERPYVFAASRHQVGGQWVRYNVIDSGEAITSSFEPAALWLAGTELIAGRVEIPNDTVSVLIDDNGAVQVSKVFRTSGTSEGFLYRNQIAQRATSLSINDVVLATMNATNYIPTGESTIITTNDNGNSATITVTSKTGSVSSESNGFKFALTFEFEPGAVLHSPVSIPITVRSNQIEALGHVTLWPTTETSIFRMVVDDSRVIKTTSRGSKDYSADTKYWVVYYKTTNDLSTGGQLLDTIYPTQYWFGYDGNITNNFTPNSFLTAQDKADFRAQEVTLEESPSHVAFKRTFYFDKSGNKLRSEDTTSLYMPSDAYFAFKIQQVDISDNSEPWTKWFAEMVVNLEAFGTDSSNYPIDYITFAGGGNNNIVDKEDLLIVYNGDDGTSLEVNGSVAKSMTMRNDTAVVMDENDAVIGELTAEPGNSVAETFEPEQLEWWSDSVNCEEAHQTASGSSVIGVSSFNGVAKKGSGFITNSVNDSILKTDLNIDSLMNEIINRLGGIPIVQKVSITSNGDDVTGLYLRNGESVTITAEENVSVDGVLDNNNQPLTLALENGQYVGTGTVAQNVEQVTLSGNNGTSTISVLPASQVTPGVIPAPTGIGAAIQFSWELVDGSEHMEYMFSANYIAGRTSGSSDMTLHFSKAGVVKEINGDDTGPMIEQTLSEIPVNDNSFEIFVSFSNVIPGTIIKAWVTGNAEFDGSTTSHASKTVYFKIPEPTTPSITS